MSATLAAPLVDGRRTQRVEEAREERQQVADHGRFSSCFPTAQDRASIELSYEKDRDALRLLDNCKESEDPYRESGGRPIWLIADTEEQRLREIDAGIALTTQTDDAGSCFPSQCCSCCCPSQGRGARGDKEPYDYLIIFPMDSDSLGDDPGRVEWSAAKESFLEHAVPVDEPSLDVARQQLEAEWARFARHDATGSGRRGRSSASRQHPDSWVTRKEWLTIVQRVILERLAATSPGLEIQMKHYVPTSAGSDMVTTAYMRFKRELGDNLSILNGEGMLCLVRASEELLCEQAADLGFPLLPFRAEVDPGHVHWEHDHDEVHADDNWKARTPADMWKKIKDMAKYEKIPDAEAEEELFASEGEDQKRLSRRLHVLQRLADRVMAARANNPDDRTKCEGLHVHNEMPAFAPFSRERQCRHLFRQYWRTPTHKETLFTPRQRIEIVKLLLERVFKPSYAANLGNTGTGVGWAIGLGVGFGVGMYTFLGMYMWLGRTTDSAEFGAGVGAGSGLVVSALVRVAVGKGRKSRVFLRSNVPSGITACFPLHDASHYDFVTRERLRQCWVYPCTVSAFLAGVPYPSYRRAFLFRVLGGKMVVNTEEECRSPSFLERVFSQPLDAINHYFGSSMALNAAFLGYYTYMLLLPCAWAIICSVYKGLYTFGVVQYQVWLGELLWFTFMIFMFFCMALFRSGWERESADAAVRWGTSGGMMPEIQNTDFMRPKGVEPALSPITRRFAMQENAKGQVWRITKTTCFILVFLVAPLLLLIYSIVYSELRQIVKLISLAALANVLGTQGLGFGLEPMKLMECERAPRPGQPPSKHPKADARSLAVARARTDLTDYENYRIWNSYQRALTFKIILFQSCNWFGGLTMLLWKKAVTSGAGQDELMTIEKLLLCLFTFRLVIQFGMAVQPISMFLHTLHEQTLFKTVKPESIKELVEIGGFADEVGMVDVQRLAIYYDYLRMLTQFALVMFASSAFYPSVIVAILENLLHMRSNATRYTRDARRADPDSAATIGIWGTMFDLVVIVAALYNGFMETYTSAYLESVSPLVQAISMLGTTGLFLAIYAITRGVRSSVPLSVATAMARNDVVRERHIKGTSQDARASFIENSEDFESCIGDCVYPDGPEGVNYV